MTLRFRASIEELLEEWCPEGGMIALLLEHATPGVYFPLVVKPVSVATDYYALPLRFTNGRPDVLQLDENSSPEDLVFRGRLELTQPEFRLPVRQELIPLQDDPDEPMRILLLRSAPGEMQPLAGRHLSALKHLVPLTCLNWIEHASGLVDLPVVRDLESLARDVARRLSDEMQDPPYFPILHAEVHADPDGAGARWSGVNLLSWNCFLLMGQASMPAYIPEMPHVMRAKNVGAWWDDVTRRRDFAELPESIRGASAKTIDQVQVLGRCHHEGASWWAFARHDKDRARASALLSSWPGDDPILPMAERSAEIDTLSPGELVRRALTVKPLADDVLLTVWLVSEAGRGINAGFRAGRRIDVLDHAGVGDRHPIEIRDYPPFHVRLSPLPLVPRTVIEARVRPLLENAVRAARRIDGSAIIERAFAPVLDEVMRGSWHEGRAGAGLFPDGRHDIADWTDGVFEACHERLARLLDEALRAWSGAEQEAATPPCAGRAVCWHVRALKALTHERLHASLVLTLLGRTSEDGALMAADREIDFQENVHWPEVLAALHTLIRPGHRLRFQGCRSGDDRTLVVRFTGELNDKGLVAAMTGEGARKHKGSFTRACETLRRAALRFGVEVTHDAGVEGRWAVVVAFAQRDLAC